LDIILGTVSLPHESFLKSPDLHHGLHRDFKSRLVDFSNADNIIKDNVLVSLHINTEIYTFSLPEYFINEGIIPNLLIPNEIASLNINSKRDKYYIFLNDIKLEILCYRICKDDDYTLYLPVYIIDKEENNASLLKYYSKNYSFYNTIYQFAYPSIIKDTYVKELKPDFIDKKLRYPKQVYEEAEQLYLNDNMITQRDVGEYIKKKFMIDKFDHATLCRSLQKTYIKNLDLNNMEVENQLGPIYNFEGNRRCSYYDQKKFKAKFKYNYIKYFIQYSKIFNFDSVKIIINSKIVSKIAQLVGGQFFQLSLLCTNGSGENDP
jgi:hypothetical protein